MGASLGAIQPGTVPEYLQQHADELGALGQQFRTAMEQSQATHDDLGSGNPFSTILGAMAQSGQGTSDGPSDNPLEAIFHSLGEAFTNLGEAGPSNPPASASAVTSLPRIKVTAYDLEQSQQRCCPVCLEDFALGDFATRVPCGHLFHEQCIKDWLGRSNQCPVCRYELATDNAHFEHSRQSRMAQRKIRVSVEDLSMRSIGDLRHLASHLEINTAGCIEKAELVERIANSGLVDVIDLHCAPAGAASDCQTDKPTESPKAAEVSAPSQTADSRSLNRFHGMSISQLKELMTSAGVDCRGCLEKSELIERLIQANVTK